MKTKPKIEGNAMSDFARAMKTDVFLPARPTRSRSAGGARINVEHGDVKNGLGQLVLTIVKLLHELLEKQAIRRIEAGRLTDGEIERMGITLKKQAQEIDRLRKQFHLEQEDLNIDLGPLGHLLKEGTP